MLTNAKGPRAFESTGPNDLKPALNVPMLLTGSLPILTFLASSSASIPAFLRPFWYTFVSVLLALPFLLWAWNSLSKFFLAST